MLFLCQLDYRHIPYNHNAAHGGAPEDRRNVATSGCGLCSLCMIVDQLTTKTLELTDCVRLSEENGANHGFGTDLRILGPIVADMYDLRMETTNSLDELAAHLRRGGRAVANVGGDHDDHIGLFAYCGHYIVILSVDDDGTFCILDPDYSEGKFDREGRRGKLRIDAPFLYCKPGDLAADVENRDPGFYLFSRK